MTWLVMIRAALGLLWGRVQGLAGAGLAWVKANPWLALHLAWALFTLFLWHEWSVQSRATARAVQAAASLRNALTISDQSIHDLQAQIAAQNLAVMQLRRASADAQAAGAKALADANARAAQRDKNASGIVVQTRAPVADCRTPGAVMATQGGM